MKYTVSSHLWGMWKIPWTADVRRSVQLTGFIYDWGNPSPSWPHKTSGIKYSASFFKRLSDTSGNTTKIPSADKHLTRREASKGQEEALIKNCKNKKKHWITINCSWSVIELNFGCAGVSYFMRKYNVLLKLRYSPCSSASMIRKWQNDIIMIWSFCFTDYNYFLSFSRHLTHRQLLIEFDSKYHYKQWLTLVSGR